MASRLFSIWTSCCVATGVVIGMATSHFLFAGPAAAQKGAPEVVAARAFHVVDAGGKVRMKLMSRPDGTAGLTMVTAAGTPAAMFAVGSDSRPVIGFPDKSGTLRSAISISDQGDLTMNVFDKNGQQAAAVVVSATSGPAINVLDKNATVRARLGITESRSEDPTATNPALLLFDKTGAGFFKAP
jgi:hypothetical protein